VHSWGAFHVLDVSSIPAFEFARALRQLVPTVAWRRQMRWFPHAGRSALLSEVIDFPLPRGYAHPLFAPLIRFQRKLLPRLLARCETPISSPLICTAPFFAPIAELWPGPVIYYSLDFTYAYQGLRPHQVLALDRRLCRAARLVCPVSARIAGYFVERAACEPQKIQVLPNATRAANIRQTFSASVEDLPPALRGLSRPVAGIIGNLAGNLDWELLQSTVARTPEFSWAFVGPASMRISHPANAAPAPLSSPTAAASVLPARNPMPRCSNSRAPSMSPSFPTASANRPIPAAPPASMSTSPPAAL
jgi:hypothetical protein